MLARALEEQGLCTTTIVLIKEHAQRVKPPRAVWAPFPFGFALGKPNDPSFQHRVIKAALALYQSVQGPVLAEYPEESDAPVKVIQASELQSSLTAPVPDPADEITKIRGYYERRIEDNNGQTQVGLSGIPQRRFRGLIRFLQSVADGNIREYSELPSEVDINQFIRLAADDLKAFYLEARMCQFPSERYNELQTWFWSATAVGKLLIDVASAIADSGDERTAQGIAR